MKNHRKYATFALFMLGATTLQAQHGCFHSPEAPTGALLLIGAVGMSVGSSILARMRKSRQ